MADGDGPVRRDSVGVVEDVGDMAHRSRARMLITVGRGDAGALLSAVLQGIEPQVGEVGRLGMAEDAEDAALFLELVHLTPLSSRTGALDSAPLPSREPHYHARAGTQSDSCAVRPHASQSPTATVSAAAPSTSIVSAPPPVVPITCATRPAAAARQYRGDVPRLHATKPAPPIR